MLLDGGDGAVVAVESVVVPIVVAVVLLVWVGWVVVMVGHSSNVVVVVGTSGLLGVCLAPGLVVSDPLGPELVRCPGGPPRGPVLRGAGPVVVTEDGVLDAATWIGPCCSVVLSRGPAARLARKARAVAVATPAEVSTTGAGILERGLSAVEGRI